MAKLLNRKAGTEVRRSFPESAAREELQKIASEPWQK